MEIGSFLELQLPKGREFYGGDTHIARINSGRAAIFHAFRLTGCRRIWLPYYQCDTVREFLLRHGAEICYYHIDRSFEPTDLMPKADDAVLFVNYYGVMSRSRMVSLASRVAHPILDCSQAFFMEPVEGAYTVYSCRKFVGVPDGAYVLGENAGRFCEEYPQGHSSDTAAFLLMRCEYGCEGKTYAARTVNEHRIDSEDISRMSVLTRTILDGTDYGEIRRKRRENFEIAETLFGGANCLNAMQYYDDTCVPMVYPFLAERDELLSELLAAKHFQGHWWSYLCEELPQDTAEYWLSSYMIPITIDQRYGKTELNSLAELIL